LKWNCWGNIQAPVLAINFADDELNPPVLGVMDRAKGGHLTKRNF
jgi:hypothetical protein